MQTDLSKAVPTTHVSEQYVISHHRSCRLCSKLCSSPAHQQTCLQSPETYHMIEQSDTTIAGWAEGGESFVIKNVEKFASVSEPEFHHPARILGSVSIKSRQLYSGTGSATKILQTFQFFKLCPSSTNLSTFVYNNLILSLSYSSTFTVSENCGPTLFSSLVLPPTQPHTFGSTTSISRRTNQN